MRPAQNKRSVEHNETKLVEQLSRSMERRLSKGRKSIISGTDAREVLQDVKRRSSRRLPTASANPPPKPEARLEIRSERTPKRRLPSTRSNDAVRGSNPGSVQPRIMGGWFGDWVRTKNGFKGPQQKEEHESSRRMRNVGEGT